MSTPIYQIKIVLRDSKPPIYRQVLVPADFTLGQLHEVIQIVMGWTDSHLHQFMLKDKALKRGPDVIAQLAKAGRFDEIFTASRGIRTFTAMTTPFGDPVEMEGEDENAVTLAEVCPKVKSKLTYEYDFGDGWDHTIEVQKILDAKPDEEYPQCLGGKLACPLEDCGGIWGYYHLLEVVADPKHEEYEDMVEWMGGDFDPQAFDLEEANAVLAEWRKAQQKRKPRRRRANK